MEYWTMLLSVLIVLLTFYYYFLKRKNLFEKEGVPFVPGFPVVGNLAAVLFGKMPAAEVVQNIYNYHPAAKYVGIQEIMVPKLLIRDPEIIKSIAVKNFDYFTDRYTFLDETQDPLFAKNLSALHGERWRDIRNLLTPAFTSSKMRNMFKLMSTCAEDFCSYLSALPEGKTALDLKDVFTRYTNDVIATCAFGISVNSMKDPTNDFYHYGRKGTTFGALRMTKAGFMRLFPKISKTLGLQIGNDDVKNFFTDIIARTIKTRDEQGIYRPDMIQLMMESRSTREPGKELTIADMVSQAFIFLFGGFDTVSSAMCFLAHELTVHPDIQERLRMEVDKVLEDTNGQLTYEAVSEMKYLNAVISETLRLYPVNVFVDRVCGSDFELPPALPECKPFTVKKNMQVWFPIHAIQRDPKYFENPDVFDPERFLEDGKKIVNSPTYLTFGLGPRMCIGNRFALLEVKVLFCHLLSRCELTPCDKTTVSRAWKKPGIFLSFADGFWANIQRRKDRCPTNA